MIDFEKKVSPAEDDLLLWDSEKDKYVDFSDESKDMLVLINQSIKNGILVNDLWSYVLGSAIKDLCTDAGCNATPLFHATNVLMKSFNMNPSEEIEISGEMIHPLIHSVEEENGGAVFGLLMNGSLFDENPLQGDSPSKKLFDLALSKSQSNPTIQMLVACSVVYTFTDNEEDKRNANIGMAQSVGALKIGLS